MEIIEKIQMTISAAVRSAEERTKYPDTALQLAG